MRQTLKKYFIPHAANNYHPHFLHTKRAILYSVLAIAMKAVIFLFVLLLPAEVFVLPDVLAAEAKRLGELTNKIRSVQGRAPLATSILLNKSADGRAGDLAAQNYFSHSGPNSHTLAYFLNLAGYKYQMAGENLAVGFSDAESIMAAWLASLTHYANLIDTDYSEFGIGLEVGDFQGQPAVYVAEHFGRPLAVLAATELNAVASRVPKPSASPIAQTTSNNVSSLSSEATSTIASVRPVAGQKIAKAEGILLAAEPGRPTPVEKYLHAKSVLFPLTSIFSVARIIYFGLLTLFIIALVINILVEIRRQHYGVIIQTIGLVVLIGVLGSY